MKAPIKLGLLALFSAVLACDVAFAAEGGGGGGLAEQVQQFIKTSGWGLLAFTVVFFILWKFLFPPIVEALDRRERTIRDSLEAAEQARAEAKELMAQHEDRLEQARAEARAIIEESKSDAERVKADILASARSEAEEISSRAKRDIELAKQSAIDELWHQSSQLSFAIAEKVIQKSLDPSDHQALVDECIQEYHSKAS